MQMAFSTISLHFVTFSKCISVLVLETVLFVVVTRNYRARHSWQQEMSHALLIQRVFSMAQKRILKDRFTKQPFLPKSDGINTDVASYPDPTIASIATCSGPHGIHATS